MTRSAPRCVPLPRGQTAAALRAELPGASTQLYFAARAAPAPRRCRALATSADSSENWNVTVSNGALVSPEEAQQLLARGYTYVDVRSEPEFALGHVPGAVNVPLQRVEDDRLVDNPEFVPVMLAAFRTTEPLLIGCRSGSRSKLAVERLQAAGFERLAELRHGFVGARDAFGRRLPGWSARGLPVVQGADDASAYSALRARCLGEP